MSIKADSKTYVPARFLKDILEIMPRGEEHRKSGKELVQMLERRGISLSLRQFQAAVLELRLNHGVVIGSLSGNGYFIAVTEEEVDKSLRYLLSLVEKHLETYNSLKHSWHNQPLNGGRQLDLAVNFSQITSTPITRTLTLDVKVPDRKSGLSLPQALRAAYLYWKQGCSFDMIVEKLESITRAKLIGFWDRAELPRRQTGGWGLKNSQKHYETCIRKIKTYFEYKDGIK